jgi:hypothetical protein
LAAQEQVSMGVQVHSDVAAQPVARGAGPGPGVMGCAPHPQVHVSMGMLVHGSADQQISQSLPPLSAGYCAPWMVPANGAPGAVWNVSTTIASRFSLSFRILPPRAKGGRAGRRGHGP